MIQFIIRSLKNPHTGELKLYPQIAPTTPVLRHELINEIEKSTVLASADIKACLDALEQKIVDHLVQGQTVRLGDLGSFRPTLTADGTADLEKCNASLIKRVRCRFTPSGSMSLKMSSRAVNFQPYKFIGTAD